MSKFAKEVNRYLIKIKCGDRSQEALKKLYDVTSNHLQIVAKVYLRNKSYADDVVIETFQKAFLYIDSFDETQDGYNWLCNFLIRLIFYATLLNFIRYKYIDIDVRTEFLCSKFLDLDNNYE